jgi:hypothetical protein
MKGNGTGRWEIMIGTRITALYTNCQLPTANCQLPTANLIIE